MSKRKVYISSTFKDLADYRGLLIQNFESWFSESYELNRIMEYMYDTGKSVPFEKDCQTEVEESDVYFLILGNRIGSYPPDDQNNTYTELEYQAALKSDKRIFRFVSKNFKLEECDDPIKFQSFKDRLKGLPMHEFQDLQSFENKFLKCMCMLTGQPMPQKNSTRLWYYLLSSSIAITGIITTIIVYQSFKDIWMTLLVPSLFLCIIIFILKDVLRPTNLSLAN